MTTRVTAVEEEIARLQQRLERERQARQTAEVIAETNLRALFEEKNRAEALVRTASRLSAQLDLATVLTAICEETAHALNLPIVSISLYDSRLEALIYTYGYGLPADFGSQMRPVPRAVYEQYVQGNLVVTDDVQALTDLPNADLYRSLDIRTTLNVSMVYEGRLAGRLNVATIGQIRHFSADEIALLRGLANQGALALENAQLFQATQRQVEELSLLNAVVVAAADAANEDELLERVTTVMGSFYPDNLGILLLDEENAVLRPHLSSRNRLQALGLPGVPLGQGITGRVALSGQPYLAADVTLDPDYLAGFSETRSELCVPLRVGERIIGVINVESPQVAAYGRQDEQLLVTLAGQLATAIEKMRLRQSERRYLEELRQAKEELELRVVERTVEWQRANEQLQLELVERQRAEAELQRIAGLQITLNEVLRLVGQQLHPRSVALLARAAISQLAGWPNVAVALTTSDGRHWLVQAPADKLVPAGEGVINRAIASQETQYVPVAPAVDAPATDAPAVVAPATDAPATDAPTGRTELAVPMVRGGRVLGVLYVESDRPEAFDSDDLLLAESLASAVALALDNAYLHSEVSASLADLRTLIDASQEGIILVNPLGHVRVVNEAAVRLFGLPGSPAEWTNRPMAEALSSVHHYAPAAVAAITAELSRPDQQPAEGESEIPPRFIRWLNLPVVSDQTSLGRLFVLHDVTEERLLQQMRDDLTHTMVHDLRNPLTAIMTSLNLLSTRFSSNLLPEQDRLVGIANRSAQQLLKLVNAILDTTRLESGQMPLKWQPVAIAELVEEVLQSQLALAEAKGMRLEKQLPAALPYISADNDLLGRILQNLVGNAIKFTPPGGSVHVGANQPDLGDGPGHLTLFVRDTGPGIPLELQNHLFQKFVTGGQAGHGSGLGLAFCRLAAEAHGGRVWLESEPGNGSTFYISLPL